MHPKFMENTMEGLELSLEVSFALSVRLMIIKTTFWN